MKRGRVALINYIGGFKQADMDKNKKFVIIKEVNNAGENILRGLGPSTNFFKYKDGVSVQDEVSSLLKRWTC